MMRRIIWRTVNAWMLWRAHRKLRAAVPALAVLDTRRKEIARQHRAGVAAIDAQKQRVMTERLRFETMGRV